MYGLGSLTTAELTDAEQATTRLMALHDQRRALDQELYTKLSTLSADISAAMEDRAEAERRMRIAEAARLQGKGS
jgi:hypothetical protein